VLPDGEGGVEAGASGLPGRVVAMDDDHIKRFNDSRMFLYLHGYLSEAENGYVKKRFMKAAEKKGVDLVSKHILAQREG
jgi:hypothetical protein